MKAKSESRSDAITNGTGSLTQTDAREYSRIRNKLRRFLKKECETNVPVIDDIYIDQIIESIKAMRKVGMFLKSDTADEFTFSRVADAQTKFAKIINDAFNQLAISRRDRRNGSQSC